MNKFALAFAFATAAITAPVAAALAAPAPCESALKDLRAAEAKATLNDADKNKVSELETKGIERCNADDDKRADDFFAQAMKIIGK
jgi:ribosomal protein S20